MSVDLAVHALLACGRRVYSRVPRCEGRIVRSCVSVRGSWVEIRARGGRTIVASLDDRFDDLEHDLALQQRPGGRTFHVVVVSNVVRRGRGVRLENSL